MVMICQEEKAGNHSLRSCKPTVCSWIQFGDCQVWQVLIFGGGGGLEQVRCKLCQTICAALSYVFAKGVAAALVLTSMPGVYSLCCGSKT